MPGEEAATTGDHTPSSQSLGRGGNLLHSPEVSVLVVPSLILDLGDTKVVGHWHRFPREAVAAPIPGSVQGQVRQGLEKPGIVGGVPGHWNGMTLKVPSDPTPSMVMAVVVTSGVSPH